MFYRSGSVRPMWLKPVRGKSDLSSCTGNFSYLKKTEILWVNLKWVKPKVVSIILIEPELKKHLPSWPFTVYHSYIIKGKFQKCEMVITRGWHLEKATWNSICRHYERQNLALGLQHLSLFFSRSQMPHGEASSYA